MNRVILFFFLVFCLLFKGSVYAQRTQTGAIDDKNEALEKEFSVWAAPAEQKVRPEDRVENDNLVWNGEEKKIKVAGAGNEHVPFQVIISGAVPEKRQAASKGFNISISDLISDVGKISRENVDIFLEHYIMLDGKSSLVGDTGYWPDGLVPIEKPFSMEAQYSVVQNRPLWVDVVIPAGTPKGTYSGTITITQDGRALETLGMEVKVYGFSLTEETPFITYMNISRNWLADFYKKDPDSKEMRELTQVYYDFLYEHRMEPWFNDMLLPELSVEGGKVKVVFDDSKYKYYMNELKTKRVLLNALPGTLRRQISAEPFSAEFNKIVKSYLSQVETYFEKNGWKDRLVFNSPIDEPRSEEDYEDTRKWSAFVHEAANGAKFLVTRTPVQPKDHPEWGTFRGHVDNFSIHGNHLNNPEVKRVIKEEQAQGGEMTWYISCDQKYPQPNLFIDAPALDPVMIPWITESYNMDGFLYWALNFWGQTGNPWLNAGTFHSGFLCSDGWILNGEGSLIYPGDYTENFTEQPDINGPVSSIRMELLREGIEDHVYLSMLKDLGAEEFVKGQVDKLVIDVSAFSRNLEDLYQNRREMAERLEELSQR